MRWENGIQLANGNHYYYCYLIVSFFSTLQMFAGHFFSPYTCLHIIFHKFSKCWFLGLPSLWYQLCTHCCLSLGLYFSAVLTICREHPQASSHLICDLCHSTRKAAIIERETTCREDLSRNRLKACWHLFERSPPCLTDHDNITLVSYVFHTLISFSLCVNWGGCTRRSLSVYATSHHLWAHVSEQRTCGQLAKDVIVKPDERKVRTRCS